MRDDEKTKEMLLAEVSQLRQQVAAMLDGRSVPAEKSTPIKRLQFNAEAFNSMYKNHNAIMYIVDLETFYLVDANETALNFYGYDLETIRTKRIPDLNTAPEEEIRAEIKRAIEEGRDYYLYKHRLSNGGVRDVEIYAYPVTIEGKLYSFAIVHDVTELKKVEAEREKLIEELRSALSEIKTLQGIIPICSVCKKILDDRGFWQQVEQYVSDHSEADFSHSLCPCCANELYPDLLD